MRFECEKCGGGVSGEKKKEVGSGVGYKRRNQVAKLLRDFARIDESVRISNQFFNLVWSFILVSRRKWCHFSEYLSVINRLKILPRTL